MACHMQAIKNVKNSSECISMCLKLFRWKQKEIKVQYLFIYLKQGCIILVISKNG